MVSSAFGLSLDFETPPPGAWRERPRGEPGVSLRVAAREQLERDWSGDEELGWEAPIDGAPFLVERGRAGDHRFVHGERSFHLLSADGRLLRSAWHEEEGPTRWRVLLDSVLFSVSLAFGYEALHAGAIRTEAGVLAIAAAAGGGKSTLLAELLKGRATLVSDDVVVLQARGGTAPLAHPGAPLMTVPAAVKPLPGTSIALTGGERWVAVATVPEPLPLAGLVLLDRGPGRPTVMQRVDDPLAILLGSLLRFPRTTERERARFEIAAAIASHVPVWRLSAEPRVTPVKLADLLRERLAS